MKLRKSSCTFFAATALALAGCGSSDSTTTYTNPVPDLLITMGEQSRKAFGAKTSADMSLKDATTKATMLSAVKVKGESSVAEANAQSVLDAKTKVDSALMEANAALTALQKAKTEADALPADTPKLKELKTELAKAITEATGHHDAIQAIKDATGNGSLAKLMEKVTGTGDKKMTPADVAAAVAVEVEKAMVFRSHTGQPRPAITGVETPTVSTGWFPVVWALGTANPKITEHYSATSVLALPGVKAVTTDYATYGYWLATPHGEDNILETYVFGLRRYKNETMARSKLEDNTEWGNTATYSGNALGFSVLTERDGRNHKAIKSGEFTADVTLKATFGHATGHLGRVSGTVKNFKGNAVGSDWEIDLKKSRLNLARPADWDSAFWGLTRGTGGKHDGTWHARAVDLPGETGRPASITGNFGAFFKNGRAMGGYAVVKDE